MLFDLARPGPVSRAWPTLTAGIRIIGICVAGGGRIIVAARLFRAPAGGGRIIVAARLSRALARGGRIIVASGLSRALTRALSRVVRKGRFHGEVVGIAIIIIALGRSVGLVVGLIAAFYGGKIDAFLMRIVDIQLSFPAILIALVLLALLGKGVDKVIIALAIVQWALYARTVRATAIVERRKEYIEAATTLGLNNFRIIVKHLLPNSISPLIVLATLQTAHSISQLKQRSVFLV